MNAEKAIAGRKGAGMSGFDDVVPRMGDVFFLGTSVAAPEDEDHGVFAVVEHLDDLVGELLPADLGMAVGLSGHDSEGSIEQKYPLVGPGFEVAVIGNVAAQIIVQFLVNILQRRRDTDARLYGKTQPVRLLGTMVRVLA